jgi:hypothetical protein
MARTLGFACQRYQDQQRREVHATTQLSLGQLAIYPAMDGETIHVLAACGSGALHSIRQHLAREQRRTFEVRDRQFQYGR